MDTKYEYRSDGDHYGVGNLGKDCLICFQDASINSEVVKCHCTGRKRRRGLRKLADGTLYVCTDELTKSTRVFNEKVRTIESILPLVTKAREDATREVLVYVDRLVHNLITLNAQAIQSIYRVVPQDEFYRKDRESLIRAVSKRLADPETTARLVIDLLKNANLEKTEYAGYKKLLEQDPIDRRYYPIHKIFMLILNIYWIDLKEKEVYVSVGLCKERVWIDYDTIAASLVHVLNNTVKYILPGSRLDVSFEETQDSIILTLDMMSFRIRPDELDSLFHEGFSGEEPKKLDRQGDGIGLYLVERLLSLSESKLVIYRDCDRDRRVHRMGVRFENNRFALSMPRHK